MPADMQPGPTTVDVELRGGETLTFGDVHVQALATPGHTPGSTCYLMERLHLRVLFSGDIIWSLSDANAARSRLARPLGTYAAYQAPRYRGNAADFRATLCRLRALPVPQLVLPGHPRNDFPPSSPVLSPERWEALLDTGIRDMDELAGRFARDGALFLDGIPKQLLPDLYYLGDRSDSAVYGFFAGSKFFLVNAPGGPGLDEFLATRMRQIGREYVAPAAVLLTTSEPRSLAGLAEVVERHHAAVVVFAAGRTAIQNVCPPGTSIVTAEDLSARGWFQVTAIPLRGQGTATGAYLIPWAAKSVLFSGLIPAKLTEATRGRLLREFSPEPGSLDDYCAALRRLGKPPPNLWLPVLPADGQNANLYDYELDETLSENQRLFR
jgi:glyoxylase-like metal-dependent hydrolase (beta-lactamase superfamily II)